MVALAAIAGILLALLALLLAPVSVRAAYTAGEFRLSVHYLFLKFPILPKPEEKPEKKGRPKKDKPKKKKAAEEKQKKKTKWTPGLVWELVKSTRKGLNTLRRHLVFYRVEIYAAVGGSDAHKAAVAYGNLNTVVYCGLSVVGTLFPLKDVTVRLLPAFYRESTAWDVRFRVRIIPLFAAGAAIQIAFAAIAAILKGKQDNKRKGGIPHESAASHQ